jgi:ubiquinone/menaquinone biosynthesis C-methylase UbiE
MSDSDVFSGSIPKLYEEYLVPLIFEPYAADLANRLRSRSLHRILEIAAGTGVVTRTLAAELKENVSIVATDINPGMLERATLAGTKYPVEWHQADAMNLLFPNAEFDAVICQFGVMFFTDRPKAFSQVYRVLKQGGVFIFNVWDRLEANEFANTVAQAIASMFPADPPRFMERTPYGYFDRVTIERDLASGGFEKLPQIVTVTARSRAQSPRVPAMAFCQATPLRNEIESRDAKRLSEATDLAEIAIAERFGSQTIEGKIQAHVVSIEK